MKARYESEKVEGSLLISTSQVKGSLLSSIPPASIGLTDHRSQVQIEVKQRRHKSIKRNNTKTVCSLS